MKEENKEFSTRDIYLATSLISLNFPKINTDFQLEGEKQNLVGYFIFNQTPELAETIKKYWEGSLLVEPRAFISNMRALKAEVINVYKNPQQNYKTSSAAPSKDSTLSPGCQK